MNGAAKITKAYWPAHRIELLKAQDFARIDRVWIAPQRLDFGHTEPRWPQRDWRTGQRPFARAGRRRPVKLLGQPQIKFAACTARFPNLAAKRCHALQKTGGDRWRAVALAGTGENHFAPAKRLGEVMRCLTELPLGRREAQGGAHRPVEECIGARLRRPDCLIKPAEHNQRGIKEPRFKES